MDCLILINLTVFRTDRFFPLENYSTWLWIDSETATFAISWWPFLCLLSSCDSPSQSSASNSITHQCSSLHNYSPLYGPNSSKHSPSSSLSSLLSGLTRIFRSRGLFLSNSPPAFRLSSHSHTSSSSFQSPLLTRRFIAEGPSCFMRRLHQLLRNC